MRLTVHASVLVLLHGLLGCGGGDGAQGDAYPATVCVTEKQTAAADYCRRVLTSWAESQTSQDATARNTAIEEAFVDFEVAWSTAETIASEAGANCADGALASTEAAAMIDQASEALVGSVNQGLNLAESTDGACGADLVNAAATACADLLVAESRRLSDLSRDRDGVTLLSDKDNIREAFSRSWSRASCPTSATEGDTLAQVEALTDWVVLHTIVTPGLDGTSFTMLTPEGTTPYRGKDLAPVCLDGTPFRFFAKRGLTNKLVVYYQGGGACWDSLTCSIPTCDSNVEPETERDNPNLRENGFLDLSNEENPFRDWHIIFVNHCGCDIHFGDAAQDYGDGVQVEHRGFHNARYVEKWAREHFLNPEVVFVGGSSAGAYGAVFHAPLLHEVWPASQFHVLADAGNGVITQDFLRNELGNWSLEANLPQIPGVAESISSGEGIPAYTAAVASHFPDANWAHYTAAYDGGSGGQSGFYNVMLNGGAPLSALEWWQAACGFHEQMRAQAVQTFDVVPSNYRYYIGTGSQHTMFGNDKIYDDTTGGVPTVVDWVQAMLSSGPEARDPAWVNVECTDCGVTLSDDPIPEPLQDPFVEQGDDVVIVCESP